MNTADRFLRFAAECEVMAKISRSSENRSVWNRLAQRWQRCAELFDNLYSDDRIDLRNVSYESESRAGNV